MKYIRSHISILLISFVFITSINAQQRLSLVLNYNPSVPVSTSFKDYVSNTSFRGLQGAVLYKLNSQFRLGLQVSWNDFYQKYPRQIIKAGSGEDISAVLSNTLQYTPVLVKGEYSFLKNTIIKPYVGIGAGVGIINYNQYYGELLYSQAYVKSSFSGDAGVFLPIKKGNYGLRLGTAYTVSPFEKEGINNISTWSIQAGITIPLNK